MDYDFVVVGAGSAGSVVARRLSELSLSTRVLLLEAGGSENLVTDFPIAALNLQNTPLDWGFRTEVQEKSCFGLKQRRMPFPRGRVLGGCSTLNYMMYIRGNPRDYDLWSKEGAKGWSWREVFPYFLKSEDNLDEDLLTSGFHSRGGPLTVQTPRHVSPVAHAFVEAGKHIGYSNCDPNGRKQTCFSIPQTTTRRGRRCSSYKAFIGDIKQKTPNLHVLTFAFVTRVLFARDKAIGVQFERFGQQYTAHARKEVILSAGSVNSPHLLMLSGIGPKDQLREFGIPVISALPVGRNLQDHVYSGGMHFVVEEEDNPEDLLLSYMQSKIQRPKNFLKFFWNGSGPLSSTGGLEGLGFIHTDNNTMISDDWPDVEIHLVCACLSSDDGRIFRHNIGITESVWKRVYFPLVGKHCFSLFPVLLRPQSRGHITLRSRDPHVPPVIDPKYFSAEEDIHTMVRALRIILRLGQQLPLKRLGARLVDHVVPGCEHYKQFSDEYLACLARTLTHTIYHPVGTCKMGHVSDPTSVVDEKLRVKGVRGLRVIDGSVMPRLVSGNTNAPIIMLAERGSDLIKGAWLNKG